jgi:hypothetical protein
MLYNNNTKKGIGLWLGLCSGSDEEKISNKSDDFTAWRSDQITGERERERERAKEAAMERDEGAGSSAAWSCATNWTVAQGSSLESSVSFDTSAEDAPALTSPGTLLLRPAPDDPPPCQVTRQRLLN